MFQKMLEFFRYTARTNIQYHLFLLDNWGCVYPEFYTIDVHVTSQGDVEQVSKEIVYVDPSGLCVE